MVAPPRGNLERRGTGQPHVVVEVVPLGAGLRLELHSGKSYTAFSLQK